MIGDFMQPTIILDQTTFDELINTLEPWLIDQNQRRALLWSAFHNDSSLYRQIDFTGAAHPFTVNLVNTLLTYGEIRSGQHALIALLNAIQQQVGVNKQQRIKRLQALLAPHAPYLSWWAPNCADMSCNHHDANSCLSALL